MIMYIAKYKQDMDKLKNIVKNSSSLSEVLRKFDMSVNGKNPQNLRTFLQEQDIDFSHFKTPEEWLKISRTKKTIPLDKILKNEVAYNNTHNLKNRLIREGLKENKCEICGITEWNGKELNMQLHHKNGNHNDNSFDNLQMLCPNCHAQTESYCGKSSNKHITKFEKQQRIFKRCDKQIIDKVLVLWNDGFLIKEIASKLSIYSGTVSIILKNNGITTDEIFERANLKNKQFVGHSKKVIMIDKTTKQTIRTFNSVEDSATFVLTQLKKGNSEKTISKHIGQVCRNVYKTAYGYIWKYVE